MNGNFQNRRNGVTQKLRLTINKRLDLLDVIQNSLDLHLVLVLSGHDWSHFHHLRDRGRVHLLLQSLSYGLIHAELTHRLFRRALFLQPTVLFFELF